jgi:F-type H+-transporting ATPase subunit b
MTVDPLTFAFEILNFLVLLWLLQRFLYKPIKAAIARRQLALDEGLRQAQLREEAAAAREREYLDNLAAWEEEKTRQLAELQQSLSREREKGLLKVREAAEAEKTRLQILKERDLEIQEQQSREQAVRAALHLTRRMLDRLAGEALDRLLLQVLMEDLGRLSATEIEALRTSLAQQQGRVTVAGARPLPPAEMERLRQTLVGLLGHEVQCATLLDAELVSGVRITIGARVLHANLGDELAFFQLGLHGETR